MKIRELKGCANVFSFTLTQMFKSKALRGTLIFMFVVSIIAYPASQLIPKLTGSSDEPAEITDTTVEKLLVIDESGLDFISWYDFELAGLESRQIPPMEADTRDYEIAAEALKEEESGVALLHIRRSAEEGIYYYTLVHGAKSTVKEDDLKLLSNAITYGLNQQLVNQMNVTQEQLALLSMQVETKTVYRDMEEIGTPGTDIEEEPGKDALGDAEYSICMVVVVVVIMIISMCGEYVSSNIVMEKSSKVVEYLLTSVRPLALMIGKVFAVLLVIFAQLLAMLAGYVISVVGYGMLVDVKDFGESIQVISRMFASFQIISVSPLKLVLVLLLLLCGVLVYSMISGIIAAGVNSAEELQESLKTYTMFLLVGAYGAMAILIMDMMGTNIPNVVFYIAYLLPLTSPFLVPGYLLIGRVTPVLGIAALIMAAVSVVLMFLFAARIYEYLMYYRGKKLGLKDYFRIFRQEKEGAPHE